MLPLFHYLFSVLVCAPLVVKYGMKKEPGYQSFLEILAIAAAFNVLAGLKVFRKDGCNLKVHYVLLLTDLFCMYIVYFEWTFRSIFWCPILPCYCRHLWSSLPQVSAMI